MALQTQTDFNGLQLNLYWAISKSRTQKVYGDNPHFITFIHLSAYANAEARQSGQAVISNHVITSEGDLTTAQQYEFLKTQSIGQFGVDFTTATNV